MSEDTPKGAKLNHFNKYFKTSNSPKNYTSMFKNRFTPPIVIIRSTYRQH